MGSLKFSIAGIPENNIFNVLNTTRLSFNQKGYRGKIKNSVTPTHITLATGKASSSKTLELSKDKIKNLNFKKVIIKNIKVNSRLNKPNKYKNYENYWIAYTFSSKKLQVMAKKCIDLLEYYNLSTTEDYLAKVSEFNKTTHLKTADHINLCNYCLPEYKSKVVDTINNLSIKQITIDKVGIRNELGDIIWSTNLV